ncbi:MAG TPA: cytochrome c biogenesis protein CcdA [Chloroflexota bacterium]|nr:cytochrome c biogenesis protein CcdA [Chloroflexota bacterium]
MDPQNLSLLVAFGAGLLSFLSPCVLPMVPIYVAYLAGCSANAVTDGRRRIALANSLAFGAGFTMVFVGFWASFGLVGYVLSDYSDLLRQVGGAILIMMGLHQAGLLRIPLLYRQLRRDLQLTGSATPATSVAMGLAFAAGWTPCVGPVLAGIIGLASMSNTVLEGVALLVAYSLGLGVPFLATALLLDRATALMDRMKRHMRIVSISTGVLLVAIGLLMLSNTFRLLPQYFNWGAV